MAGARGALEPLIDAYALFVVEGGDSTDVSMAAAQLLASGYDSPHLRELAGEPSTSVQDDIAALVSSTMSELGIAAAELTVLRVLRLQCERQIRGELSARALGKWVVGHYSWSEGDETDAILLLDDDLDELETLAGDWSGPTREELEAEVSATARVFLASYPRE